MDLNLNLEGLGFHFNLKPTAECAVLYPPLPHKPSVSISPCTFTLERQRPAHATAKLHGSAKSLKKDEMTQKNMSVN